MSVLGRAVKNTVALTAAELFSKAVNFVFIAVLARQLTPDDFGGYTTVMTLVWFIAPLADLGISQILVREIAADRSRAPKLLFNALVVTTGLSGLAWLIIVAIAVLARYPDTLRPLIIVAGLAVAGNTLMQTVGSALRAFERMEVQALLTSGLLLVSSAIGIGLALAKQGLAIQVGISVIVAVAGAIISLVLIHRHFVPLRGPFDIRIGQNLIGQALPVAALVVCTTMLHWCDLLILGQVRSMNDVAIYGSAIKMIDLVFVFSNSAVAAMFPVISFRWRKSVELARTLYARSLRFFVAFGLAVAVGLMLLADPIVVTVFGNTYRPAALPLRLLGWAYFFQIINRPAWLLLVASGNRLNKFVPAIGVVAMGNIALNLLLAPRFGPAGSASAFVLTSLANSLVREWVSADYLGDPPRVRTMIWRPAIAGLVMGLCLFPFRSTNLIVSIPLGSVIFVGVLGLLGELKEEPYHGLLMLVVTVWRRKRLSWREESS
jgi:O-antigen/teichoic acid export membrane protein